LYILIILVFTKVSGISIGAGWNRCEKRVVEIQTKDCDRKWSENRKKGEE
jgi:hypothetical protein